MTLYVQGAGKRKHIYLNRNGNTGALCGAWWFGVRDNNPTKYPPKESAKVCKHCERIAAKAVAA
jgi:hypothetical protein